MRLPLLALLVAAPSTAFCLDDPPEWRDRRAKCPVDAWNALEGQAAPSLAGLGSWENTAALDWTDFQGNVVLLHLWGSWAGTRELGYLVELHEKYGEQGFVVLGVHSKRGAQNHADLIGKENLPYVVAADKAGTLEQALTMKFWPTYFLIDRDGKVRMAGLNKNADKEGNLYMDQAIGAVLAEPWEGQRKLIAYVEKAEEEQVVSTRWPAMPDKRLNGKDVRGEQGPTLAGLTWLTEEPDLAGKCVLIDLWATWCGPCVRGMPDLQEWHERFGEDLVVIGVSSQHPESRDAQGQPWGSKVADFLAARSFTYAQALDQGGRLKSSLNVTAIPHVILMDSTGIVRWQGVPAAQPDALTTELVAQVINADRKQRGAETNVTAQGSGDFVDSGWPETPQKKLYAKHDYRGKQAPDFVIGEWITKEPDRQGKVVVIDFWATWCEPCRKLIPEMNQWTAEFGDEVAIIGVSDEDAATVKAFLEKVQVDYPIAIDPSAIMKGQLGVDGIPHVLVVDSQGIVRWQGWPDAKTDPLTKKVLRQIVEQDKRVRAPEEDF